MRNLTSTIISLAFVLMTGSVSAATVTVTMTAEEYQDFQNAVQLRNDALLLLDAYEEVNEKLAVKQEANEILMSEVRKYKDLLPVKEWNKLKEDQAELEREKARVKAWELSLDKKLKNAISKEHKAKAYAKKIENYVAYEMRRLEEQRLVRVQKKILKETLNNLRDLIK